MFYHSIHRSFYRHRLERKLVRKFQASTSSTIIMEGRDVGFFSMFFQVIGALHFCKKYQHNLQVNFVHGPYYEKDAGDNWWRYYFSREEFNYSKGTDTHYIVLKDWEQKDFSYYGRALSSSVGHMLVELVDIKNSIRKKVSRFRREMINGQQVVGVHYRGTDKVSGASKESGRVPYEDIYKHLLKEKDSLFFIATDEQAFLDYMKDVFTNKVVSYNAIRSNNSYSIHSGIAGVSMYQAGEDALIDCLLLSCCKKLIRTDSNLSYACRFFNPSQKTVII